MKNVFLSKEGISHIKTAVMVLVFCMILSAVLTYAGMMTIIQNSKDTTNRVLDSFVTHNTTVIYDSLKNGHDFTSELNDNYYKNLLFCEFSLDFRENNIYALDDEGQIVYYMTNPDVTYDYANTLKLKSSYTIGIPVRFAGKVVTYLKVPLTVYSYYKLK